MLNLFLFFYLIDLSYSSFLENYCDYILDSKECIESVYCAWCNTTKFLNNEYVTNESCIFKNTCSKYFNDTDCSVNPNHYQICNFTTMIVNLVLIFIYITINYTIIKVSKNLYDTTNNSKFTFFVNLIISTIVFVPSLTLWFIGSSYYLPYLMALITLTFFLVIFNLFCNYKKRNIARYSGYHQINNE